MQSMTVSNCMDFVYSGANKVIILVFCDKNRFAGNIFAQNWNFTDCIYHLMSEKCKKSLNSDENDPEMKHMPRTTYSL